MSPRTPAEALTRTGNVSSFSHSVLLHFLEKSAKRAVILLPIEAPNAVLDVDKTLATRRVHKYPQLVRCAVITRRKLEHRLNAVQWESAQIREHAFDELLPTEHSGHSTEYMTKSYAPSSIPSFVPLAVAVP
jgi:hypothetical protein